VLLIVIVLVCFGWVLCVSWCFSFGDLGS